MINKLIKLADLLDKHNLGKEANYLDSMIKAAMNGDDSEMLPEVHDEHSEGPEGHGPGGPSEVKLHFPIERHEWQAAKRKLREHEVGPELEQRDLRGMQEILAGHSDSEGLSGYLVIDPFNNEDFRKYVQREEAGPNGEEIIVPLNTFALAGIRINYFKTARSNKYGFIVENI